MSKTCLFCSSPAVSREHIFAEQLTKRMKVRASEFQPTLVVEDTVAKTFPKNTAEYFKTKQVCEPCNNGWMAALENDFQAKLGMLVEKQWPVDAMQFLHPLFSSNDFLIRWMAKTAIVYEKAMPKDNPVVPEAVRNLAKLGGPFDNCFLLLGHIVQRRFAANLMKGFPVFTDGGLTEYQAHPNGFSFSVCLNHLALRLICCPDAEGFIKQQKNAQGDIVVPMQIHPALNYPDKVCHSFPTLEMFSDSFAAHAI